MCHFANSIRFDLSDVPLPYFVSFRAPSKSVKKVKFLKRGRVVCLRREVNCLIINNTLKTFGLLFLLLSLCSGLR